MTLQTGTTGKVPRTTHRALFVHKHGPVGTWTQTTFADTATWVRSEPREHLSGAGSMISGATARHTAAKLRVLDRLDHAVWRAGRHLEAARVIDGLVVR